MGIGTFIFYSTLISCVAMATAMVLMASRLSALLIRFMTTWFSTDMDQQAEEDVGLAMKSVHTMRYIIGVLYAATLAIAAIAILHHIHLT